MTYSWSITTWAEDLLPADHVAEAQVNTIWQYADKPRLTGALAAIMDMVQTIEDVALQVLVGRSVYTAVGSQLDTLGNIVGQERGLLSDDAYRVLVLGRIAVNRSRGKMVDLEAILDLLGVTDAQLIQGLCGLKVSIVEATYGEQIWDLLEDFVPGGVRLLFTYSAYTDAEVFSFSSDPAAGENDAGRGFEHPVALTGGRFSR